MKPSLELAEKYILDRLSSSENEIVGFLTRLIATPSENPPGDETGVANVITDEAVRLGLQPRTVSLQAHRPNVLVSAAGPEVSQHLLLCGHMDTKPAGDMRRWRTDPFKATIKEGKMYGLGASDMKGALAAMLYAGAALADVIGDFHGGVTLAFTADEEAGGRFGAEYLAAEGYLRGDIALVCEPSGITTEWEYLDVISRGETCFKVKVRGTPVHSSISDIIPSTNATVKMAEVLVRFSREFRVRTPRHPLYQCGVTVTPGIKAQAGSTYGVLPGYAEFSVEVRTVPGMIFEQVLQDVEDFVRELRQKDTDLDVEVEFEPPPLKWIAPTEVSDRTPLVRGLLRACQAVLGQQPKIGAFPAWTDARFIHHLAGIPSIPAFGPGLLTVCHSPDEYVPVQSVLQASKVYALGILNCLASQPRSETRQGRFASDNHAR